MSEVSTGEVATRKPRRNFNVSATTLVQTWNKSESSQQAADTLGVPRQLVLSRIATLRKKFTANGGSDPLKVMPRESHARLDINSLRDCAVDASNS